MLPLLLLTIHVAIMDSFLILHQITSNNALRLDVYLEFGFINCTIAIPSLVGIYFAARTTEECEKFKLFLGDYAERVASNSTLVKVKY